MANSVGVLAALGAAATIPPEARGAPHTAELAATLRKAAEMVAHINAEAELLRAKVTAEEAATAGTGADGAATAEAGQGAADGDAGIER